MGKQLTVEVAICWQIAITKNKLFIRYQLKRGRGEARRIILSLGCSTWCGEFFQTTTGVIAAGLVSSRTSFRQGRHIPSC